jgi:hypothetical protein
MQEFKLPNNIPKGTRGSLVGWCTMPNDVNFFSLPNPSSRTMASNRNEYLESFGE